MTTEEEAPQVTLTYRVVRWIMGKTLGVFFQEIDVVGKKNVPASGPVIFVGNHPNQFVDGMMMFSQSPRDTFLIIAASSLKNYKVAGFFARLQHAIPVYRREDNAFKGKGELHFQPASEESHWTVTVKGVTFTEQKIKVGDQIAIDLPEPISTPDGQTLRDVRLNIVESKNDNEVVAVLGAEYHSIKELVGFDNSRYTAYTIFPKLDQSQAYSAIFSVLARGDCIGVFPEGGSSDHTQLRKLKVGVAYIALSLKRHHNDLPVTIVPCGLNYISGHRFRSKSLIEYGPPLVVSHELVERFKSGDKAAVEILTDQINSRLRDVTLNIPPTISEMLHIDQFEAREVINTARRLYQPTSDTLSVDEYLELNRRFANGISRMSDEPKLSEMLQKIREYNADLRKLYLTDRQVQNAPKGMKNAMWGIWMLIKRITLLVPYLLALPGFLLHLPIAALTRSTALSRATKSAAKSDVKIEGRDVIASTKIATGFVFLLIFYSLYGLIAAFMFGWIYLPIAFIGIPLYSYFCIQYVDRAFATARTLLPLMKYVGRPSYRKQCHQMAKRRMELQTAVRALVRQFGPKFTEYWDKRMVSDQHLTCEGSPVRGFPFSPIGHSYHLPQEDSDLFSDLAADLLETTNY